MFKQGRINKLAFIVNFCIICIRIPQDLKHFSQAMHSKFYSQLYNIIKNSVNLSSDSSPKQLIFLPSMLILTYSTLKNSKPYGRLVILILKQENNFSNGYSKNIITLSQEQKAMKSILSFPKSLEHKSSKNFFVILVKQTLSI